MEKQRETMKELAKTLKNKKKVIVIPGNGNGNVIDCNWYGWIKQEVESKLGIPVLLTNFPDPLYAHESVWVPFVIDELCADEETILVGHSSGAVCSLRTLERTKVKGVVLVSAYKSDLGDRVERESGYFNHPWDWKKISTNAEWIVQFHSLDDHLVPFSEARFVNEQIKSEYHEKEDMGHFQDEEFDDLFNILRSKLNV